MDIRRSFSLFSIISFYFDTQITLFIIAFIIFPSSRPFSNPRRSEPQPTRLCFSHVNLPTRWLRPPGIRTRKSILSCCKSVFLFTLIPFKHPILSLPSQYGAEMVESSVKSISRPVIDRLPVNVNQIDEFACRQLDRIRSVLHLRHCIIWVLNVIV